MVRLILMTDFTESYGYNILSGILRYSGRNWMIHKMPPAFKQRYGFDAVLKWAIDWKADAIIGRFDQNDPVEKFRENGILAMAQDYKQRFSQIPNLTGAYVETGEMAADFFLSKGFRNFAFFGYRSVVWSDERCQGYVERLKKKGVREDRIFVYQDDRFNDDLFTTADAIQDWLMSIPRPAAVFCCDDNEASNLIDMCNWKGIRVPEELAILGVDDSDIAANICNPPLSSISLDASNAAFQAAAKIDRAVNKGEEWDNTDILVKPVSVVGRLSSDNFPTNDEIVVRALKYISQNYQFPINVKDIVNQVPVSRRVLEVRFLKETGSSILQYINSMRMQMFAQMLLDSDDSVSNIASMVGFEDPSNVARVFKRTYGTTPSRYRKDKKKDNIQ